MIMANREKTMEDTTKIVEMVAEHNGWKLCPDEELLEMLKEGLMKNYNRYGYFSCPCRDASGNKEKDKDIICPCNYCVPDQKEYGHCYCGLYLTKEYYETGRMPQAIPERREMDDF